MKHTTDLDALKQRLAELGALEGATMLLHWDQATFLPDRGGTARGRQLEVLQRLAHERGTDPALGRLLAGLSAWAEGDTSTDAALVRVAQRDFDRATRVPDQLVGEIAAHTSASYGEWCKAREANDFAPVADTLARTLDLSRRYADCFDHEHIADPLIDRADGGFTVATLAPVFATVRTALVPLAKAVIAAPPPDTTCLNGPYDTDQQVAFSRTVAAQLGYDFERGRLDESPHPFTVGMGIDDVRITTRVRQDDLTECLFSTIHEAGHGMYEQGIDPALDGTPLATGTSSGLHESQSRLWENRVGRSEAFWDYWYGPLQAVFPGQLAAVSQADFYRAIHEVSARLIRTDADELTYDLHVMMRFDLECDLLTGAIHVADLPEIWAARMTADQGITPPDHNSGVLQDVHWFAGLVGGAFQGYTLGNMMSAQLYEAAELAMPALDEQFRQGDFSALKGWLNQQVHYSGRGEDTLPILQRATGRGLDAAPYIHYLTDKYRTIYGL